MDNQNNQNRNNNQDPGRNNRQGISFILLVTLITSIVVLVLFQLQGMGNAEEISYIMQEIVESDLVFNISVYTNDDNIIFYSLPEQHSQPDVEVILEKMEDEKKRDRVLIYFSDASV